LMVAAFVIKDAQCTGDKHFQKMFYDDAIEASTTRSKDYYLAEF